MKNILMNTEMTKATLEGRKTQIRRIVKVKDKETEYKITVKDNVVYGLFDNGARVKKFYQPLKNFIKQEAEYQKDEVVLAREQAKVSKMNDESEEAHNECTKEIVRIFLKITDVRVERLQECSSVEQLEAEGIRTENENGAAKLQGEMQREWQNLWNKTAPKGYKWSDNPYVFVYEFERVDE